MLGCALQRTALHCIPLVNIALPIVAVGDIEIPRHVPEQGQEEKEEEQEEEKEKEQGMEKE